MVHKSWDDNASGGWLPNLLIDHSGCLLRCLVIVIFILLLIVCLFYIMSIAVKMSDSKRSSVSWLYQKYTISFPYISPRHAASNNQVGRCTSDQFTSL